MQGGRLRLRKMEIGLVQLRHGNVLDRDAVMGVGGDHGVAMAVILRDGKQLMEICKNGVIDFDRVRVGMENW